MNSIRGYRPEDSPRLLGLFRETIHRVNSRDYSPEQVNAWASDAIDEGSWAARFEGRFVVVAEIGDRIAGFAELEPEGQIDRVFVSANYQGIGIGRALMESIEQEARRLGLRRISADVSLTARQFFERNGFVVVAEQVVVLRGVEFRNVRMARGLA